MLRSTRNTVSFLTILLLLVPQVLSTSPIEAAPPENTYSVNSTEDLPDGNVSDNLCLALNGDCTLCAAIMQANFTSGMDNILLPAGTYKLTLTGVDDNDQFGDLDISDDLTIQGDGPDQITFGDDCYGAITSFGHNLLQSTTNCTINVIPTDLKNVDPLLGSLGNNGGPTQTQALLKGSPAIDAANPNGCIDFAVNVVTTDQRGFARPVNGRCDIGAYEYYPFAVYLPLISP